MKKVIALVLASVIALGMMAAPSLAGKKKKKKPAPVTQTIKFEEEGTMTAPAPTGLPGVTENEFTLVSECASMPASQGVDGYVIELPAEYQDGNATVEIEATDASGLHDLNLYFYDAGCSIMEPWLTEGANPSGTVLAGAKWAVVNLVTGAEASFKLTATNTITVTP